MNEDSERYARRGPQGATGQTGETGETGETGQRGEAGMDKATRRAIVILFLLSAALAVTSILFTVGYVTYTHSHHQAARQREQAAAALAAQKAEVPVCTALLHLAQVKGSHGNSGATYGENLQAAFRQVYAATNCPKVLKAAR